MANCLDYISWYWNDDWIGDIHWYEIEYGYFHFFGMNLWCFGADEIGHLFTKMMGLVETWNRYQSCIFLPKIRELVDCFWYHDTTPGYHNNYLLYFEIFTIWSSGWEV